MKSHTSQYRIKCLRSSHISHILQLFEGVYHCNHGFLTFSPLQFRTDIARTEYLSNADERLRWQANSLPADDLCTENAIMLKRFNRLVSAPDGLYY